MNERIRQLVKQATERFGVKIWDESAGVFYTETHLKLNQEKFAELIVKECLGIVANADITGSWITHPKDVLYVACDQVKKHFGVEDV